MNYIACFLFGIGAILGLSEETTAAAVFLVGGWLVFAMTLAVERLERR